MQILPFDDIIKIQPKGLITIPKKVRKALGLEENMLARLRTDKGRLIVESVRTLPYPVRSYTDKELAEFVAYDKEQGKELRRNKIVK